MSDLIRRQDIIGYIDRVRNSGLGKSKALEYISKYVERVPSAEAVDVVRCRDCLMTKERDAYTGRVWCCRHREYMDDMYYCADGLRREEDDE